MTIDQKRDFIREMVAERAAGRRDAVMWSTHAIQRLLGHGVARAQVETALASCEVIENYPEGHRALPDCLVLGFDNDGSPVHAVVAIDDARKRVLVVTAYRPDRTRWHDGWKTRR